MDQDDAMRWWVGGVLPLAIAGLCTLPWVLGWGTMPDPVATHFGLDGVADRSQPLAATAIVSAGIGIGIALALAASAHRRHHYVAWTAAVLIFVGVLMGVVSLATVVVNRGLSDWHAATLGWGWMVVAIGAACGCAIPVATLAQVDDEVVPSSSPALPMAVGERAAWFGRAHSGGFLAGAAVELVVGTLVLVLSDLWFLGATLLFVGAVMLPFASVEVTVSDRGLRVRSGVLPWPRLEIPLAKIESAHAIDVRPVARGGWGYRGSLRVFGRAAWVVRAGPGLEVQLSGGRRVVVTVDDPEPGAAVVNGLRARAG